MVIIKIGLIEIEDFIDKQTIKVKSIQDYFK